MLKKKSRRASTSFMVAFLAGLAFLLGAVKIWDVPADKIWAGFLVVVLMVGMLALMAFFAVLLVKMIQRYINKR